MEKVSFSDGLAIGGGILAILLIVFDKAGKLKGPVLYCLLAVAACMTLPLVFSIPWVADAQVGMPAISRRLLMFFCVCVVYSALIVWVSDDGGETSQPSIAAIPTSSSMRITGATLEPLVPGQPIQVHIGVINDGDEITTPISKFTSIWVDTLPSESDALGIEEIENKVWKELREGQGITIDDEVSAHPVPLHLPPKMEVHITDTSLITVTPEIIQKLDGDSGLYFAGTITADGRTLEYCVRIDRRRNHGLSLCRSQKSAITDTRTVRVPYLPPPIHEAPTTTPSIQPEVSARFIQATSPGIVLFNRSQVVVRDPTCALQMWNLSKTPPIAFPSFDAPQTNRFIKPGTGVIAASFDNPTMKPLMSDGDRIFGYVSVDCPDCKDTRFYWLYAVYNHPTESWYSEIPVGTPINIFTISRTLEQSKWDIDVFMSQIPHGPRLRAENGFDLKPQ